ncbi:MULTISPECIES: nitronate monooxygenase [unclassified Enterococcus]|uniref:NAD(P)H-dependent flavin oxidoreductase n=1 Tax=unclassified Enterococcus TaxID=2608891 RepID=UPI0013EE056D|nr:MULTISPECIES: nitronate monooxygenase [unclassified Enterococcus]
MAKSVTEILGIQKPIIQGPMNWLTNGEFVGAVSKTGALGVLGINAGQTQAATTIEETIANMRKEVRIAKSITANPIGMNVYPMVEEYDLYTEPMLEMMVEEGVEVAVMVGNFSKVWTRKFKENGIKVVYRGAPTVEVTEEAIEGGADVIVATGFDEGGTVPDQVIGTFSIVPLVVDAAKGRVPVLAAGGITDTRTAKAALALGADGIFAGTVFLASKESPLAENIKDQLVASDATDMLLYRTVPAYYRSLPGKLPQKLVTMDEAGESREAILQASGAGTGMRDGMLFGDLEKGFASLGLGISMIHQIQPVETIVDRLMEGMTNN